MESSQEQEQEQGQGQGQNGKDLWIVADTG